jgi:DNA-directed RNA polymerase subunit E'/Rpb7
MFGDNLEKKIVSNVVEMTEGKKISPFGVIVVITSFYPIFSLGKILPGSSSALFRINYTAITYHPLKGEVVNTIVTNVTKFGFFAEAGLLNVFVSKELVPFGFKYNDISTNFISKDGIDEIKIDSKVLIRIVGTRNALGNGVKSSNGYIQAIGSMKDCFFPHSLPSMIS